MGRACGSALFPEAGQFLGNGLTKGSGPTKMDFCSTGPPAMPGPEDWGLGRKRGLKGIALFLEAWQFLGNGLTNFWKHGSSWGMA